MRSIRVLVAVLMVTEWCRGEDLATGRSAELPVRVALLSGQNNHNWRETTPQLKSLLESTRTFQVDVHEQPDKLTAAVLAPYAVIVSNWNEFGQDGSQQGAWPAEARQAYLQFVRGGKGHVVIHAGSSSFADWPDYQTLTLAWWQLGQTSHGPQHTFTVHMGSTAHPITRGLDDFAIHDELWHRPGQVPSATVLASVLLPAVQGNPGQQEPVALVDTFGQGRSFTLLLGHDVTAMQNPGFQTLFRRGTEWAATGRVGDPAPEDLPPTPSP